VHGPGGDDETTDAEAPRGRERSRRAASDDVSPRAASRATAPRGLRLGARELAAIYLGGVRPSALLRASRIAELSPGSAELADRMFASERTPHLSIWF
jgi:hypothetical protein